MFASVIHDLCYAGSLITLSKDPTLWTDGVSPANICITPSLGWMVPTHRVYNPQSLEGWVCHSVRIEGWPNVCFPNVCWPNVCFPNVCFPNVCWPNVCWPNVSRTMVFRPKTVAVCWLIYLMGPLNVNI